MRDRFRFGWMSWPIPKLRVFFSMRGFFGAFFDPAPAFDWGNGAGAAFFPALGGYH